MMVTATDFRILASLLVLAYSLSVAHGKPGDTRPVTFGQLGAGPIGNSSEGVISSNGRYLVFCSFAPDIVPGDYNDRQDVFLRDLQTNAVQRVTLSTSGEESNADSMFPDVSNDGRYVTFSSHATNLVPGDTNGKVDVFMRDTLLGVTIHVSHTHDNKFPNQDCRNPSLSDDGMAVVYVSSANNIFPGVGSPQQVYLRHFLYGLLDVASRAENGAPANSTCGDPSISGDGQYISFMSGATNLVPNDTNMVGDVFVRDWINNTNYRASVSSNSGQANAASKQTSISDDGRYVAFTSSATNLVTGDTNDKDDIFHHDMLLGITRRVSVSTLGIQSDAHCEYPRISATGQAVVFETRAKTLSALDSDIYDDIYLHLLTDGSTMYVSKPFDGGANVNRSHLPSISGDARFVVFDTPSSRIIQGDPNNSHDVVLWDASIGKSALGSIGTAPALLDSAAEGPEIAPSGRYIAFYSYSSNASLEDDEQAEDPFGTHDVFLIDTFTNAIEIVSWSKNGGEADSSSLDPDVSDDGRYVAFASYADNLTADLVGLSGMIFIRDRNTAETVLVSKRLDNTIANQHCANPSIGGDGTIVVFETEASNLIGDDTNGVFDIYMKDMLSGAISRISLTHTNGQADSRSQSPDISGDASAVVFQSSAHNMVPEDTSSDLDVFMRDLKLGTTRLVSAAANGSAGNGTSSNARIAWGGRYVVFSSTATNLVSGDSNEKGDVFWKDMLTGQIRCVSMVNGIGGNNDSSDGKISPDGRFVLFKSYASNLVTGDTNSVPDTFLWSAATGRITRISVLPGQGHLGGGSPVGLTRAARRVFFESGWNGFTHHAMGSGIFLHEPSSQIDRANPKP